MTVHEILGQSVIFVSSKVCLLHSVAFCLRNSFTRRSPGGHPLTPKIARDSYECSAAFNALKAFTRFPTCCRRPSSCRKLFASLTWNVFRKSLRSCICKVFKSDLFSYWLIRSVQASSYALIPILRDSDKRLCEFESKTAVLHASIRSVVEGLPVAGSSSHLCVSSSLLSSTKISAHLKVPYFYALRFYVTIIFHSGQD